MSSAVTDFEDGSSAGAGAAPGPQTIRAAANHKATMHAGGRRILRANETEEIMITPFMQTPSGCDQKLCELDAVIVYPQHTPGCQKIGTKIRDDGFSNAAVLTLHRTVAQAKACGSLGLGDSADPSEGRWKTRPRAERAGRCSMPS
ncbi:MAG: hypothetical protein IIA33_08630 [Planctomycetes bacterium]|nr:hypothetical protein [Planctomycetota bacterium]